MHVATDELLGAVTDATSVPLEPYVVPTDIGPEEEPEAPRPDDEELADSDEEPPGPVGRAGGRLDPLSVPLEMPLEDEEPEPDVVGAQPCVAAQAFAEASAKIDSMAAR